MRVTVVANTAWYLVNFRLNLMQALLANGYDVVAVAPDDPVQAARLRDAGVTFAPVSISGSGTNPLKELFSVWQLRRVFKHHDVQLVLSYTPKGNLYSALAALACGLPFVPNVSGLGRSFIRKNWVTRVVKLLYRLTLGQARKVFFQNMDDMDMFVEAGLVPRERCDRLPGSGVDLARFAPAGQGASFTLTDQPPQAGVAGAAGREKFVFLLVARLLWDKGVGEYVDAARKVKQKYPAAQFRLLGFLDVQNPSAIPRAQAEAWVAEGVVGYLGSTDDVLPYLREADCVVLPSYREGVPRTLLEAAAMAKPLITTDAPGCRDAVDDGVTGFLCRLRDADDLADKMLRMIEMDRDDFVAMGHRGREKMVREFDERIVINRYLDVVGELAKA